MLRRRALPLGPRLKQLLVKFIKRLWFKTPSASVLVSSVFLCFFSLPPLVDVSHFYLKPCYILLYSIFCSLAHFPASLPALANFHCWSYFIPPSSSCYSCSFICTIQFHFSFLPPFFFHLMGLYVHVFWFTYRNQVSVKILEQPPHSVCC